MNKLKKLIKSEKGQSMVEFALVLPILLMLLLGIAEFGWLFNAKITITSAAREGARVYAVKGKETNVKTQVQAVVDNATGGLTKVGKATVTYSGPTAATGTDVQMITVKVTAVIKPIIGLYVKNYVDVNGNISLSAQVSMRVEYLTDAGEVASISGLNSVN